MVTTYSFLISSLNSVCNLIKTYDKHVILHHYIKTQVGNILEASTNFRGKAASSFEEAGFILKHERFFLMLSSEPLCFYSYSMPLPIYKMLMQRLFR